MWPSWATGHAAEAQGGRRDRPSTGAFPFVSPAAATALFLIARLFLGFTEDNETSTAGMGADLRAAGSGALSVEIRSVDERGQDRSSSPRPPPETEGELLRLFRRDGAVRFEPTPPGDEPPVREFTLEEVGVIRVRP